MPCQPWQLDLLNERSKSPLSETLLPTQTHSNIKTPRVDQAGSIAGSLIEPGRHNCSHEQAKPDAPQQAAAARRQAGRHTFTQTAFPHPAPGGAHCRHRHGNQTVAAGPAGPGRTVCLGR